MKKTIHLFLYIKGEFILDAWIIKNGFIKTEKFSSLFDHFVSVANKKGLHLTVKKNNELFCSLTKDGVTLENETEIPAFAIFWDKDMYLAENLECLGIKLYNSKNAIALCDDKALTHQRLSQYQVNMPKTMIAPKTFPYSGYSDMSFCEKIADQLKFPLIIKENFGSFGNEVYKVNNLMELIEKVKQIGVKPMIFQEFIQSSFGQDIRIQVVGGEVVACMKRYTENGDFRANVTNGAKMQPYTPTKEQKEIAIKACEALELDFAGVDLLFGKEGEPLLCEVNSNAHMKNLLDCTGIDVTEKIVDYILKCEKKR